MGTDRYWMKDKSLVDYVASIHYTDGTNASGDFNAAPLLFKVNSWDRLSTANQILINAQIVALNYAFDHDETS